MKTAVFGRPDLTLKRHKLAIFVDSEFFHGKDWETAKRKVLEFYKTLPENPNELQIVAKYEVSKIEKTIEYYLEREKSLYNQTKVNRNNNAGKTYLEEFPFSSKRREVSWLMATITQTWGSYYSFLNI